MRDLGLLLYLGESWDRLEVFLGWEPGGISCWPDPSSRRNNRQRVEKKFVTPPCNKIGPSFVGFSVCGGRWNGRGLFLLGGGGLGAVFHVEL